MKKLTKVLITKLKTKTLDTLKALSEDDIAFIIQQANHAYHSTEDPIFSDNIFDIIHDHLKELNPNHPILKNVGAIGKGSRKEELPYYMGSLDKIKADPKAIEKFQKDYPSSYVISDKLDGNSALYHFDDEKANLYTRGDGTIGQNITHLLPFIGGIPKKQGDITIRGELIISKKDFEKVKDKGANARNMVSGLVNSKIPDLEIAKYTNFIAYEVIDPVIEPEKQLKLLSKLGFKPVYHTKLDQLSIENLSEILITRRKDSDYEIDGIVVYHNKVHPRVKKENPPHGFAFKSLLTMERAEVIVSKVEWSLSKDAYLVPVIIFPGVNLDGVTIARAHGFNGKFINDNKIGPGSKLVIIRSGQVIPYVQEILSVSESGEPSMPDQKYIWSKTGVDIMLDDDNKKSSDEVKFKNIENFFDKVDVVGLSTGNIRKMYDSGLKTVKAILTASKVDLLKVEGFKEKMADKIYEGLQERMKNLDCLTLISATNALGRGLGKRKIEILINEIPTIISKRYIPTVSEITKIKGFEKKTAELFVDNMPKYWEFVDENDLQCIVEKEVKTEIMTETFKDEIFVFTGFRDAELEAYIKSNGGTVASGVNKKTTYLIRKDTEEESGKITKANELGVKIIKLSDFKKKYTIK